MDANVRGQNLLTLIDSLVERENRINRTMTVFENYTPSNRLRNLRERAMALPATDQTQTYERLVANEDWLVLTTNLDSAIANMEQVSTLPELAGLLGTDQVNGNSNENSRGHGHGHGHGHCVGLQELIDTLRIIVEALELAAALANAIAQAIECFCDTSFCEFIICILRAIASFLKVISNFLELIIARLVRRANLINEYEKAQLREVLYCTLQNTQEINGKVDQALCKLEHIEDKVNAIYCRRY